MHILIFCIGIFNVGVGIFLIFSSARSWPVDSSYKGIPNGKYTTTTDFVNDEIVVKDVYGNKVIVYKRSYPNITER